MRRSSAADPFGTAALRDALVSAWQASPTRLREDSATEADLVRGGYRDRVLTELAQNAADAAARAGTAGTLTVWRDGPRLHVANTGAPLDVDGVQALTALRASTKTGAVGRFGVGFTAVLAVSEEIEVRSTTGSIRFSAESTRETLAAHSIDLPDGVAPTLRLVWPSETAPSSGDTEVVLTLRDGVDAAALLERFRAEAVDLLLELPALHTVVVEGDETTRREKLLESGLWEVRIGDRCWWEHRGDTARRLVPVRDGVLVPIVGDVLRAPTRSDEELSLPVVLIADVPMQPDRRRVLPGAPVERVAQGYAEFVASVPAGERPALIPAPGLARSAVDERLRESILDELRTHPWLPAADGGADLAPDRAVVLPGLDDELAEILADIVPGLVVPALCESRWAAALASIGVRRLGPAALADALAGHERAPSWWFRLYDAVAPSVIDGQDVEELAALPVPLADGRTVTGPRTTVMGAGLPVDAGPALSWMRLVHPDAAHPLLTRLGARTVTAEDVLADPALAAAIDDTHHDDTDRQTATDLAGVVLTLVAAAPDTTVPPGLGGLLVPDITGELAPVDELLLPGAPLAEVLVDDSPFGTVDEDFTDTYGVEALRAVGAGWGFTVLHADLPTGPDHGLPDEGTWWKTLADDPEVLVAVRDLDLVDERHWARALTLLAAEPDTAAALTNRDGYTAWWLRMYAVLDDQPLGHLRAMDDLGFEGLLDPCTHPDAGAFVSCLAGTDITDHDLVEVLLDRLGDPGRSPAPAVTVAAHAALAHAYRSGRIDADRVLLPSGVRSLDGTVVDGDEALVVDRPWLGAAIPAGRLVPVDMNVAGALAELLDVAVASTVLWGEPVAPGRATTWRREPDAALAAAVAGLPLPDGTLVLHERLVVRRSGAEAGDVEVPWWVDSSGAVHCVRSGITAAIAGLAAGRSVP